MLDLKFIRENPEEVRRAANLKNVHVDLDALLQTD
jgi:seryl-tRNA synthetase